MKSQYPWRRTPKTQYDNSNDFQPAPAGAPKVNNETMKACCTQTWYAHYALEAVPDFGIICCPCGSQLTKDERGWWVDPTRKPTHSNIPRILDEIDPNWVDPEDREPAPAEDDD